MSRAIVIRGPLSDTGFAEDALHLGVQVTYVDAGIVQQVPLSIALAYTASAVEIRDRIGQVVRANIPANMTPIPVGDVTILFTVSKD